MIQQLFVSRSLRLLISDPVHQISHINQCLPVSKRRFLCMYGNNGRKRSKIFSKPKIPTCNTSHTAQSFSGKITWGCDFKQVQVKTRSRQFYLKLSSEKFNISLNLSSMKIWIACYVIYSVGRLRLGYRKIKRLFHSWHFSHTLAERGDYSVIKCILYTGMS